MARQQHILWKQSTFWWRCWKRYTQLIVLSLHNEESFWGLLIIFSKCIHSIKLTRSSQTFSTFFIHRLHSSSTSLSSRQDSLSLSSIFDFLPFIKLKREGNLAQVSWTTSAISWYSCLVALPATTTRPACVMQHRKAHNYIYVCKTLKKCLR